MSPSKIVITGTIASGKSTLVGLLADLGFDIISADEVNRDLLEVGALNYEAIKNSGFFEEVFDGDKLDKKKLAAQIFADGDKMYKLNSLTHPNIMKEINARVDAIDKKAVFIEIPLYFQMEERYPADEVWLVTADYNTQLERLMERDGIDIDYAKSKIETQKDLITIEAESDIIFNNSTTVEDLRDQLIEVLEDKNLL